MRQYKIGEYAKYMGVTPDLLKHYEDLGVITPSRSESGYRYYPFNVSMLLLECIRLRNYGMTLREIKSILTDHTVDNAIVDKRLENNIDLLREESRFDQALIEDYEEFLTWQEPLHTRDADWCIRWSRPMYFLPHTNTFDFLDDPRIYELLQDWMSRIPIVKSAMRVQQDGTKTWGLVIEQKKLHALGLPLNDIVVSIPSQKVFYYQFRSHLMRADQEQLESQEHPALQIMQSMGLTAKKEYYRVTLMPADWQKEIFYQYGYYAIALEESVSQKERPSDSSFFPFCF